MDKTFHIVTFGCQMNKLDSELLRAALEKNGMRPVRAPSDADVLIYNTCSVRQHAEDRVLSHLGGWRKRAEADSDFILGVVGCMAQRLGDEIRQQFPFVRLLCGTRSFLNVPEYIGKISSTGRAVTATGDRPIRIERDPAMRSEPHHAYVSIMRGCSNFCTYCIVPHVRGPERSRPETEIVDEVQRLTADGVAEVTLLGQNVNAYGRHKNHSDGAEGGLPRLLERVNAIENIKRVRFVTNHPKDMTEDILRSVADNEKVCEHLHMPIQSASDRVLKAMNRRYTRNHYLNTVEKARRIIPGIAVSSDFIVGFPGESDSDFEDTLALLRSVQFHQSYIFRYSPRPGTDAVQLADDVPDQVKRERQQALLAAQKQVDIRRRNGLVGETLEVMCHGHNTHRPEEGRLIGRSRRSDIVVFDGCNKGKINAGDTRHVTIEKATALTLFGRIG